jgi:hypothetical protein
MRSLEKGGVVDRCDRCKCKDDASFVTRVVDFS